MNIYEAIEVLTDRMKEDYAVGFMYRLTKGEELKPHQKDMIANYNEGIEIKEGRKYIKILSNRSVWGFIVATDDDKKFKKGDILMAAGYNAPARNAARGNVFNLEGTRVQWTGANYL